MDAPAQALPRPLSLTLNAPPEILDAGPVPASVPATTTTTTAADVRRGVVTLLQAVGGTAIFGFALRTAAEHAIPGLGHLAWAASYAGALLLAWAVCLPALYVFWASHQEGLGAKECVGAALDAFGSSGAALASTAPILWFFSVTAPHSRILSPLALAFAALALAAGGAVFGTRLRGLGGRLGFVAQWAFAALVAVSFVQFAYLTGIRWF
ncbi:MAG TPA: hypothetical protein VGK67_03345 [Myxococcales bacterium]|jgi:hypothetical protein